MPKSESVQRVDFVFGKRARNIESQRAAIKVKKQYQKHCIQNIVTEKQALHEKIISGFFNKSSKEFIKNSNTHLRKQDIVYTLSKQAHIGNLGIIALDISNHSNQELLITKLYFDTTKQQAHLPTIYKLNRDEHHKVQNILPQKDRQFLYYYNHNSKARDKKNRKNNLAIPRKVNLVIVTTEEQSKQRNKHTNANLTSTNNNNIIFKNIKY